VSYEDEEQVERLRKWWQENWKAIVGGLVIGLSAIFGWEAWQRSGAESSSAASYRFDQLVAELDRGQPESASALRDELVSDYRRTPYATLATLRMARSYVEAGDLDRAATELEWARDNARDDGLKALALVRLARVRWAAGDAETALALLDGRDPGPHRALYEELRGDVLLSEGRRAEAREAYERALTAVSPTAANRELIERKLEDLADVVTS
jgi:predicted negative regulator of RcsB-dependent stress response